MNRDTKIKWWDVDDMDAGAVEEGTAGDLLDYDETGEIADALAELDAGAEYALVGGGAAPCVRIELAVDDGDEEA